jgi:hypothetical protein
MSRTLGVVAGVQATGVVFGVLERASGWQEGFTAAFAGAGAVCAVAALIAAASRGRRGYHGEAGSKPGATWEEKR